MHVTAFGIGISSDKPEVYPKYVCILCKRTLLRARKESAAHCGGGCGEVQEWTQHTRLNCTLCTEQSKPKSKGRPKKSTHTSPQHLRGRAAGVTSDKQHETASEARQGSCQGINVEGLKQKAMPAYKALSILAVERFADQNAVLKCPVCTFVVDRAIELTCCASLYCCECIYNSLQSSNQCIECGDTVTSDMLVTVHKGLQRVTGNFTVHCDFHQPALRGCPTTVQLSQLQRHVESCCYNPDSATGALARAVNLRTSISDVLAASPSKLQGDVSGRLAGHLVKSLSDGPGGGGGGTS